MRIVGPPEVSQDLAAAIARRGIRPRDVALVSPLGVRKGMRFAYRVEGEDGRIVKARHFGTAAQARIHYALRSELEDAFGRAIAVDGAVVFEEWVAGEAPTPLEAEARAEEAGALLGRLHSRPLAPDVPGVRATSPWHAAARADAEILREGQALSAAEVDALVAELGRRDPSSAPVALIHKDFCAENFLIDRSGHLRVIDNEQIAIEPIGFDLGRTFHRWPMARDARAAFRRGYRSTGPGDAGAEGFWRIVAVLVGARVFFQRMPERLESSVAVLRRLLAGEDLDETGP